jgi:phage regulator Rha-like protein
MLDRDLATLYEVSTKALNLAVQRNQRRFPDDFRFQLTVDELRSLRFQIETSKRRGGHRYLPWAFTQEGVAMLSGILRSERAVAVNIEIMRAFVHMRQAVMVNAEVAHAMAIVEAKLELHRSETGMALADHAEHIRIIFETLRGLMGDEEGIGQSKRVGFDLP